MSLPNGHLKLNFELSCEAIKCIESKDWSTLDNIAAKWLAPSGELRQILLKYCDFTSIEHILALRSAPDDEGIWHDDGSRLLAFSLSLTLRPEDVQGGSIYLRQKGSEQGHQYPTQPPGTLIIFNTGRDGYEHRVSAVTSGERLVLAGWCT